tara:strand:+ start:2343 stop:2627 length:285 start_codon:yes stop_codon:yes gene_type:complete
LHTTVNISGVLTFKKIDAMIKIISKDRYDAMKQENLLLKLRLYNVVGSYNNYSYNQLNQLRKDITGDLKAITKRMKELDRAINRSTSGGGNDKP